MGCRVRLSSSGAILEEIEGSESDGRMLMFRVKLAGLAEYGRG